MNRRTQQLLSDLADARPIQPGATTQAAPPATRQAMFERITDPHNQRVPARRPPRRVSRMLPVAIASATFVVVAALAIGLLPGQGPGGAPPASALELAARTAAAQPFREPGPGERWYQRTEAVDDLGGSKMNAVGETWVRRDGVVWTRIWLDGPGVHETGKLTRGRWGDLIVVNTMSFEEIANLPADPAALRARLEAAARKLPKDIEFREPVVLLALSSLPHPGLRPEQRAALFRVVAGSPGATDVGPATDPRGRPVVAVTLLDYADPSDPNEPGQVLKFMFAKDTSQLTALVSIAADDNVPGIRKGQQIGQTLFSEWKVVPAPKG